MEYLNDYDSLFKICKSRQSTRVFSSQPVPSEIIGKIKEIAASSPYASGRKNWEIKLVSDHNLLGDMALAVEKRAQAIMEALRPDMREHFSAYLKNFTFFATAPAVFVLTFRAAPSLSLMLSTPNPEVLQWERDNYLKSISCVAMLILLAAESLGLGGCYVTGALLAERELAALIPVPPGRNIGALIPIGYKAKGADG